MINAASFLRHFRGFPSITRQSSFRGMARATSLAPSKAWRPSYQWVEGVENVERYCPGGYHPIRLGDEFCCGRYQVIHKLGYGSFSTVWLARDRIEHRYVALKVITAAASEVSLEARIMRHLRQSSPGYPGHSFVLSLLDDFSIDGPNGRHQCIVSEVVGNSLVVAKESTKDEIFPLTTARVVTPQLALGLAYIHSCGVLHGGW